MPNPKSMIRKTRRNEEELVYELFSSRILEEPMMGFTDRMVELLNQIHTKYDSKKRHMIPAGDFDYLREAFSPPTIIKAKKILGIRSIRRNAVWYWSYPRKSPMKAMSDIYTDKLTEASSALKELKAGRQQRAVTLVELLKNSHYFAVNEDIYKEMQIRGYTRKTVKRTKSTIGVLTKKVGAFTMWVYPAREVQDWLETYLSAGAAPVVEVLAAASSERGWNRHVIEAAKLSLGNIRFMVSNKIGHWYDAGNSNSLPDQDKADNLLTPEQISSYDQKTDGFIIVDFTAVSEEDDASLLPEEFQITIMEN